jgi:redox-sensitive bicupin YhaK (pirin superfamily)
MMRVRHGRDRGATEIGWLDSRHTFSFGDYYDPGNMHFRALRVINEDRVAPRGGFPTHPHRDMEIITYVVAGGLQHQDSMGNGSLIQPGEVQRMSAGTGIQHSEVNPSKTDPVHLLQIWIMPDQRGLTPSYEQKHFGADDRRNRLRIVAADDGRDGAVTIHQDARLYASLLDPGARVTHELAAGRHAWLQLVRGEVEVDGVKLEAGDGAAIDAQSDATGNATGEAATPIVIAARADAELLLFDLA